MKRIQAVMKRMQAYCYIEIGQCVDAHFYYGGDSYHVGILPNGSIRYHVIDIEGNDTSLHKDEKLSTFESMVLNDLLDAYFESVAG